MLEWTKWGQRTSPLVTQTSTVNHQLSNEWNLKREIERQVDLIIESKRTTCHKLRISNWFQRNPKCSHIPSNPIPLFSPSLTLALCEPLSPFSASSDSLLGRWLSRTWASSKSPPQSVAAVCMLIRWPFCAWCVTSGAATAAPNSAIQQITGRWPREAAPTCSASVLPAAFFREAESLDMERTRSTLSFGDSLSQQSLSIGPRSPAQTSTTAAGPALEEGKLQCHSTVPRRTVGLPSPSPGVGHLSNSRQPFLPLQSTWWWHLTNDATTDVLAIEVDLGGTALALVNVYIPPVSSCPRNYAPDLDALLEKRGDQMVFGHFNAHHRSWFSSGSAWWGCQQFAACGCEHWSEHTPLLSGPALLARCHPSERRERASGFLCDLVHRYHPWIRTTSL